MQASQYLNIDLLSVNLPITMGQFSSGTGDIHSNSFTVLYFLIIVLSSLFVQAIPPIRLFQSKAPQRLYWLTIRCISFFNHLRDQLSEPHSYHCLCSHMGEPHPD